MFAFITSFSFTSCKKSTIVIGPGAQPTHIIPGVTVPQMYRVFIAKDPGPTANYTDLIPYFADSTGGRNPVLFFTTVDCAGLMPEIRAHFQLQANMQPQKPFYLTAVQDKGAGGAFLTTYTGKP